MAKSVELYKNETEVAPEQLAWHAVILSSIYESWGYYHDANQILETGLKYAQLSKTPHDNVSLWTEKALLHSNDLNYVQGEFAAQKALAVIDKNPVTQWRRPYALLALASSYRESGKLAKSVKVVQQIIKDPKRSKIEIAFANYAQGKVQLRQYKLDMAAANLAKAISVYSDRYGDDSAQIADSKALLFLVNTRKNRNKLSPEKQNELIKLFETAYNRDHINNALLLDILAEAHFLSNNLTQAIELQQKAIKIYKANANTPLPGIILASLHLVRYHLLNHKPNTANEIINALDEKNIDKVASQIIAEYHLLRSWLAISHNDAKLANQHLLKAGKYLKGSEFENLIAEYYFKKAQVSALHGDWLQCIEKAQSASKLASKFYPQSWSLPNLYNYLAEMCTLKANDSSKTSQADVEDILMSSWRQEIKLINNIIFQNK